ncbi:hypothetical protein WJX84_011148 [Apatococcus fuscideae]|uniref:IREH1/IRE-like N-terminal domain-containing protein n=1 Tax=Apatococcus fuscideae TaxID=2026836 RepID=A0AAW1T7X5_9CHLO
MVGKSPRRSLSFPGICPSDPAHPDELASLQPDLTGVQLSDSRSPSATSEPLALSELAQSRPCSASQHYDSARELQPEQCTTPRRISSEAGGFCRSRLASSEASTPGTPASLLASPTTGHQDLAKLPSILSSLDLRGLIGSPTLTRATSALKSPMPPATARTTMRTFETAKSQVDSELLSFNRLVTGMIKEDDSEPEDADIMQSLVDISSTCIEEDVLAFKNSIQRVVDQLEEMRQQCSSPKPKNMITRLLFILTQCSRLLLTEAASPLSPNAGLYATLPRNRMSAKLMRFTGFPSSTARRAGIQKRAADSPKSPIARAITLPSSPCVVTALEAELNQAATPSHEDAGTRPGSAASLDSIGRAMSLEHSSSRSSAGFDSLEIPASNRKGLFSGLLKFKKRFSTKRQRSPASPISPSNSFNFSSPVPERSPR